MLFLPRCPPSSLRYLPPARSSTQLAVSNSCPEHAVSQVFGHDHFSLVHDEVCGMLGLLTHANSSCCDVSAKLGHLSVFCCASRTKNSNIASGVENSTVFLCWFRGLLRYKSWPSLLSHHCLRWSTTPYFTSSHKHLSSQSSLSIKAPPPALREQVKSSFLPHNATTTLVEVVKHSAFPVPFGVLPAYAIPCSDLAAYSSACSCFGVTPTIITASILVKLGSIFDPRRHYNTDLHILDSCCFFYLIQHDKPPHRP